MFSSALKTGIRFNKTRTIYRYRWFFIFAWTAQFLPVLLNAINPVSAPLPQLFLATQLIVVCTIPAFNYVTGAREYPPIFPLICLSYAYQFAVPVFTNEAVMETLDGIVFLSDNDVLAAQFLALVGAVSFIAGYFLLSKRSLVSRLPAVNLHLHRGKALVYCLAVVALYPFISGIRFLIGQAGETSTIENLLLNQLLVTIGILSWLVYSSTGPQLKLRALLCVAILLQLYVGLASTVLETPLVGLCILIVFKWTYTKRLPVGLLVMVLALVFFLQPVKVQVRQGNWYGAPKSAPEKATAWVEEAGDYWWEAITTNRPIRDSTSATFRRADFIHQFAHIYSLTPSVIPYQYGGTYSFFLVSFIPRIIWPEKPVTTTNTFYGITYNITTKEGAERSNFGISLVGESFINFGLIGVLLIMLLQGSIFGTLEKLFAGPKSGAGGQAIFLSCSIWFLNGVGSSAEILFGGIIQNLLASAILLSWARARQKGLGTIAVGKRSLKEKP